MRLNGEGNLSELFFLLIFPLPLLPSLVPLTNLLFLLFPTNSCRNLNNGQFHRLLLQVS